MLVRFWGTRGSIATPGPGTIRFGGNTSCVEVTTSAGDRLIFDCGTGARAMGSELMANALKPLQACILLSHTHWDHIQGFPFFAPFFLPDHEFAIYGPEGGRRSFHQVLAGQMEYAVFPVGVNQLPAAMSYHNLREGTHQIGHARVVAQYLHHPAVTLGYRVEADGVTVVYLCDHEPFADQVWRGDSAPGRLESILHEGDRRHARFMAGADLVIHDAQYTPEEYSSKRTWGHSTYEYAVELAAAAGVQRLALTHHDPAHDDAAVAEIERRAQALAERRGSRLEVFCAYEGCEVSIRPRQAGGLSISEPMLSSNRAAPSAAHVLIVDDSSDLRLLVVHGLTQDGMTVSQAGNGAEGLRLIEELHPDLVVLNLEMPQMGGMEVLRALRSKPGGTCPPVLILTAHGDESRIQACFNAGAMDYLSKPFSIPQLNARVRACLVRAGKS